MVKALQTHMPQEIIFKISYFKVIFVFVFTTLFGAFFSFKILQDEYLFLGFLGLIILTGAFMMLFQALKRPTLKLDPLGLIWGHHRFSWQQVRTFHSVKTLYSRDIWIYFEGHEKPFVPTGSKLKDLWRKLFPEEKPFGIDVSFFKAKNDEIEEAMDQYYFPARGLSLDDET